MVRADIIPNCPVIRDYIKNSNTTFGPDDTSLKGKNVEAETHACGIKLRKDT